MQPTRLWIRYFSNLMNDSCQSCSLIMFWISFGFHPIFLQILPPNVHNFFNFIIEIMGLGLKCFVISKCNMFVVEQIYELIFHYLDMTRKWPLRYFNIVDPLLTATPNLSLFRVDDTTTAINATHSVWFVKFYFRGEPCPFYRRSSVHNLSLKLVSNILWSQCFFLFWIHTYPSCLMILNSYYINIYEILHVSVSSFL